MGALPENMLGLVARPPAPPEALLIEGFGRVLVFAEDASLHDQHGTFNRRLAGRLIEALIDRLDLEAGDTELEAEQDIGADDEGEIEGATWSPQWCPA